MICSSQVFRNTTYKLCYIDIDTSLDKVVDLLHQAIPTCLQQFHLFEQWWKGRGKGEKERVKIKEESGSHAYINRLSLKANGLCSI